VIVWCAALATMIYASVNVANGADFHKNSAIKIAFNSAPTSVIVNESQPKNLSVIGANNASISSKAATLADANDS